MASRRRVEREQAACRHCGAVFGKMRKRQVYCSHGCACAARRRDEAEDERLRQWVVAEVARRGVEKRALAAELGMGLSTLYHELSGRKAVGAKLRGWSGYGTLRHALIRAGDAMVRYGAIFGDNWTG